MSDLTFQRFHNALRIMSSVDRDECERVGLVPRGDHNAWGEFRRNPYRWFLRADDVTARIFWNLIETRQPKVPQRDSHGTSAIRFTRTGRTIAFLDVYIGSVFFVHGRYWTRTDFDAGSEIVGSDARGSCCNFIIDGTMKPNRGPFMYPADELCETCAEVEEVTVEGNDRK